MSFCESLNTPDDDEGLADLLLDSPLPSGTAMLKLTARCALRRVAELPISKEENEALRDRAFNLVLIRKGRGRGGSIGLAP